MSHFQSVLFDLDGTLVDTAPDLGFALNTLLEQEGRRPLAEALIRPVASNGSRGLLALGFGIDASNPTFRPLQQRFIQLYQDNLSRQSHVFPGMEAILAQLEQHAIPWGIVTNKPAFLTDPLCEQLKLSSRAACIVSGDTTPYCKPHPAPLLHGCNLLAVSAQHSLYIGDAARDIEAGKRAHMTTITARYGYIEADEDPASWQADGIIDHPDELSQWL